jgi:hypothetical protein
MKRLLLLPCVVALAGCPKSQPPAQTAQQPPPTYYPQQPYGYPPQQPAPYGYPPQQPYQPAPAPTPAPAPVPVPAATPALLPPLIAGPMEQDESRAIIAEIISHLSPDRAARVRGIPLVWDPDLVPNAYAGCDDSGNPFIAGTQGLLDVVDAMAETTATDELFGTQTYAAYVAQTAPQLLNNGSGKLTAGIIPVQYWADPRRMSRKRELFDEVIAFTFGHEMGHHYLGHTGCANGQAGTAGPPVAALGHLATAILPGLNQPNEVAADNVGITSTLDSGLARQQQGLYRWKEKGAYLLLDFFGKLDQAAGISPLNPIGFLRTHPNSAFRLPLVQGAVSFWYSQHPGTR